MADTSELLSEQVNVAVTRRVMRQLERIETGGGLKPAQFGRIAIAEKLAAMKKPAITPEEAKAILEARCAGLDPVSILRNGMAEVERDRALDTIGQQISPILAGDILRGGEDYTSAKRSAPVL